MQYRQLAHTDLNVSRIAFGAWGIAGGFNWGPQDENDSLEALLAAHECGVNFFDTAEGYGDGYSEHLVGKALGQVRDEIILTTKVLPGHFAPDALRASCERSLKNLGTDRIDLYQLHWPNHDIPVAETFTLLEELKSAGKIRFYGVSNFGPCDLDEALVTGRKFATNQVSYSLLFRAIEYVVQPLCAANEVDILCYSPLMQGLLAGKFPCAASVPDDRARTRHFSSQRAQTRHGEAGREAETFEAVATVREIAEELGVPMADLSMAWLLAQPAVACVLAGARNAEQARRNVAAAELKLSDEVIARLAAATEPLKRKLGPVIDMWMVPPRVR